MNNAAPLGMSERIGELDVLRGFALLGVFIVHFVLFGFHEVPRSAAEQAAMEASALNQTAMFFTDWLFYDKANTLFATLFGMGFWVMMERLEARGVAFTAIYLRRLLVLFLIGMVNLFLIFPGDVLHDYAALGLLLLLLKKLPRGVMLVAGLILAIFAFDIQNLITPNVDQYYEQFAAGWKVAFEEGSYLGYVSWHGPAFINRDIVQGTFLGWGLYIFGRFLIGAWVIRTGWLQRTAELLPEIKKQTLAILPIALVVELLGTSIHLELITGPEGSADVIHAFGAPLLALGYALLLIVIFHSRFRSVAAFFAPVGRAALTCYVAHGAVWTIVFFRFGLDLGGVVGPIEALFLAIAIFIALTLMSHWWLARYAYGPLEYLWRWATYGKRPKFVLAPTP